MTRKLSLLNIDNYHDDNIEDCGTKHFIIYEISNKEKLSLIENRNYYKIDQRTNKKISNEIFTINENDYSLIGSKIGLRSPITCCGKHICATCYGRYLSRINKDLHTGIVATLRLTEPLTQRLLSAKHLLSTDSEKINWGETFEEYFEVNLDKIYFSGVEVQISFDPPNIEDFDEDQEAFYINGFNISIPGNKKSFYFSSPTKLFLNNKLLSDVDIKSSKKETIKISSEDFSEDDFLFSFENKNNELIESLTQIIDLIETREHLGITDYNELINKFCDLLIENKLGGIPSVHLEMISSRLITDEDGNKLDFSKEVIPEYKINRVSKIVMDSPVSISLAFERINEQLLNPKTYKKEGRSFMDFLFK